MQRIVGGERRWGEKGVSPEGSHNLGLFLQAMERRIKPAPHLPPHNLSHHHFKCGVQPQSPVFSTGNRVHICALEPD